MPSDTSQALWGGFERWAVGDAGTVLVLDGGSWVRVDAGTSAQLRAVWGEWVVGDVVLRRSGEVFSAVSVPSASPLYGVSGSSRSDVWAVGLMGTVLRFDGGTWAPHYATGRHTEHLAAVWSHDAGAMAVGSDGGSDGIIFRFEPARYFWSLLFGTGPLYSVWGSHQVDVWAGGRAGLLLHWDGSSWQRFATDAGGDQNGLWGRGPNDIWSVTSRGEILHWDGGTWSYERRAGGELRAVWGDGTDVWAAGADGLILRRLSP